MPMVGVMDFDSNKIGKWNQDGRMYYACLTEAGHFCLILTF